MQMKMRPRYYCDHCKKVSGSKSAMAACPSTPSERSPFSTIRVALNDLVQEGHLTKKRGIEGRNLYTMDRKILL